MGIGRYVYRTHTQLTSFHWYGQSFRRCCVFVGYIFFFPSLSVSCFRFYSSFHFFFFFCRYIIYYRAFMIHTSSSSLSVASLVLLPFGRSLSSCRRLRVLTVCCVCFLLLACWRVGVDRCDTQIESRSSEETTSRGKSRKSMGSTTNASAR